MRIGKRRGLLTLIRLDKVFIVFISLGQILDVRDTESIWCQARIAKVYSVGSRIYSVLVHYLQWAKLYD